MKTKRKEKEKRKKRKEGRYCPDLNSGPSAYQANALPLGHVEHTGNLCRNFIIKTFEPY